MNVNGKLDKKTWQRLDNAIVVKQLTSSASVFAEAGILSPIDADNLRLNLSSLQFSGEHDEPVLIQLVKQNAEFISLLKAHFGGIGLSLNILRHTLRGVLNETAANLSEFGEQLLVKAQLLFNRPLFVYLGGACERRTLYSSILVDFAQVLYGACEQIQEVQDSLYKLVPSDKSTPAPNDAELDKKLAKQMGFKDLCFDSIPYLSETLAKQKLVAALNTVEVIGEEVLRLMGNSRPSQEIANLTIITESLHAQIQLLSAYQLPKTDEIEIWELKRLHLLTIILEINAQIKHLASAFQNYFSKAASIEGATKSAVPQNVIRSMSSSMINEGVPALKASAAACALVRYCEKQNISPKQILVGELSKIDPHLTITSLEVFKELYAEENIIKSAASEKQRNLERKDQLLKLFHQKLTQMGLLGVVTTLCFFFLVSCGVKTAPKSDLIDFSPQPHFHSTPKKENPKAPAYQEIKTDPLPEQTPVPKDE